MSLSPVSEVDDEFEQAGKPAGPCVMVVFGATGDLTMRKLVPALYNLEKAHLLPQEFAVLGVAIDDLSLDDFRKKATRFLQAEDHGIEAWEQFQKSLHYLRGDFGDPATYTRLGEALDAIDQQYGTGQNYLFYMATAPKFFCEIVRQLGRSGLSKQENGRWRRVVIEKPFGQDLDSALTLNQNIKAVLSENQIYRIDHYLGKETVQNIMVFRFGNGIFEPIWNRRYIDHVAITNAETVGVELIDVSPVPDRLKDSVAEAEHHDVLHGFLAEIMIDPINLVLREHGLDVLVEGQCRVEILSERLLDDHSAPAAVLLLGQARPSELPNDLTKKLGRCRHIKKIVLTGPVLLVDRIQRLAQPRVGGRVTEVPAQIMQGFLELLPCLDAMVLGLKEASGFLPEIVQAQIIDGHTQNGKFLGQEVSFFQVIQGRNELAHGEVAGGPEDDHDARSRGFASLFEFVVNFANRRQRHFHLIPQWALTVNRLANACQGNLVYTCNN